MLQLAVGNNIHVIYVNTHAGSEADPDLHTFRCGNSNKNTAGQMLQPHYVLRGHRSAVNCLSFARQGEILISGDAEGLLKVWDLQARRAYLSKQVHDSDTGVLQLHAVDLPQPLAITQGRNGTARCWQIRGDGCLSEAPIQVLSTGAYSFCRCAILHRGCAAAPSAGVTPASEQPAHLGGEDPRGFPSEPDILPKELHASRLSEDMAAAPNSSNQAIKTSSWNSAPILGMPSGDGSSLGIWYVGPNCSNEPVLQLHQQRGQAGAKHGMCMAVQLAQDTTGTVYACVGYEDGVVALWDTRQPKVPMSELQLHEEPVMAITLDLPGGRGVSAAADGHLSVFKMAVADGGQLTSAGQLSLPAKPGCADLSLRWDARVIASAGWDCKVRLWSLKKNQLLAVGQYHSKQVTSVEFNEQQQVLASGAQDCHIAVWPAKPV